MTDITPARWRPATTEPALMKWPLIALCLAVLTVLLFALLIAVFEETLRRGWAFALAFFSKPDAKADIRLTLTAIVVPLDAGFGIAAAWAITKFDWRGKAWVITLIDLPFSVSPVVAGLLFVLIFGANSALGAWLVASGFPIVFAVPGIVLATLFITLPFVARELIPVMLEQGRAEEEAALTLGATGWRTFLTVTLPNIRWALLNGVHLCNARAMPIPASEKELLPYLAEPGPMLFDIALEVGMTPQGGQETVIARANYRDMYCSAAQQLAHHTACGCPMRVGDLLGSGTISGPEKDNRGSLLELSWGGKEPLTLSGGEKRSFIEDGDTLTLRGHATGVGYRIGFGAATGQVLPARKL